MVSFEINDKALEAEAGRTILEVARELGIAIPTLCWHEELSPYGACRLCLVEIVAGGRPGLEAACVYKITDGLKVKTDTERVKRARKIVFELLLARCSDSENLNKLAAEYGVTKTRIKFAEEGSCLLCGLCVRVCAEISERHGRTFSGRGVTRRVETPYDKLSDRCIGCGACAHVCPMNSLIVEEAD